MSEFTRPQGGPKSDDGGADGTRGPVPPPSVAERRGAPAALFAALLHDRGDERLLGRALRSRVGLRAPHGLVLVCGLDCDPAALGRVIAGRLPRAVCVAGGDAVVRHAAVVVPAPAQPLWSHALTVATAEARARFGLLIPRPPMVGLRALRAAYFAALADAVLALALDLDGPLVSADELVVPRMLAALPDADAELLLAPLRPVLDLPSPHRGAYVRTLDALGRHGGTVPRTAEHLHVHPNTVRYRIGRLEEMTGLRLDDPHDRLRLDLAATLVRLRGCPASPDVQAAQELRQSPDQPYRRAAA